MTRVRANVTDIEVRRALQQIDHQLATGFDLLKVDHIAEKTVGHGVHFDNLAEFGAGVYTDNVYPLTLGYLTLACSYVYAQDLFYAGELYATKATGAWLNLRRDDTTVYNDDLIGCIDFQAKDTTAQGGVYESVAKIVCYADEDFDGATIAGTRFDFKLNPIGTETPNTVLTLSGTYLRPALTDPVTLGTGTYPFSDLHLKAGGTINWANGYTTFTNDWDDLYFSGGNMIFSLGESNFVRVDAHTTGHTGGGGSLEVRTQADNNDCDGIYNWMHCSGTTGRTLRGVYSYIGDATAKTANDHTLQAVQGYIRKTGADNTAGVTILQAVSGAVLDLGSVAGERNIYGGEFVVVGSRGTAYGVYALAIGADTNWAGYFDGNVNIQGNLTISGTVDGVDVSALPGTTSAAAMMASNNALLWAFFLGAA